MGEGRTIGGTASHKGEPHPPLPSASARRAAASRIASTTHRAGASPFVSRIASRNVGLETLPAMRVPSGLKATHWSAFRQILGRVRGTIGQELASRLQVGGHVAKDMKNLRASDR